DVGRSRARQGADAATHELRRVVPDGDPRRVRSHPERQDEEVYQLVVGYWLSVVGEGGFTHNQRPTTSNRSFAERMVLILIGLVAALVAITAGVWVYGLPAAPLRRSFLHEQGDDRLLESPRDTRGDSRGRPRSRDLRRARTPARRRRQYLQGPGFESAARHAVGVR